MPSDLRIDELIDERWHPSACPVRVMSFSGVAGWHLVVDAPNWANAKKWGAQGALKAWWLLKEQTPELPVPTEFGSPGMQLWLVVPGFPADPSVKLWEEPFSRYLKCHRNPPSVLEMAPVHGTPEVRFSTPSSLLEASAVWGRAVPSEWAS